MNDLLHHPLQEQEWFGILALVFVIGIFGLKALRSVLAHMRAGQEHDAATTLKMEMIQRGMSAVEIERILAAKISGPGEPTASAAEAARPAGAVVAHAMNR